MVDVACPVAAAVAALEAPEGWVASHRFHSALQRFTCLFTASSSEALVPPGGSVGRFLIASSILPRIGSARVWG